MDAEESRRAAERLRIALELHDFGVALYAQRLRREAPDVPEEAIRNALLRWLHGVPAGPLPA